MAETWVLNERLNPVLQLSKTTISFTSNGQTYTAISFQSRKLVYYTTRSSISVYIPQASSAIWTNSAFRTITFDSTPTGSLLSWLQTNGTKQGGSEPDTPTSSRHVCLIDGTGYSTKQGKPLIDGTAYTLKKGRTLIDGTGYDIDVSKKYTVTIAGTIHVGYPEKSDCLGSYCKIGDDKYTTTGTVEAAQGTKIIVQAGSAGVYGTFSQYTYIYLNGSIVAQGQNTPDLGIGAKYEFELSSDTTITFNSFNRNGTKYNTADITT